MIRHQGRFDRGRREAKDGATKSVPGRWPGSLATLFPARVDIIAQCGPSITGCLSALVQCESMPDVMREEECTKIGEVRPEVSDTQCRLLFCLVRHSRVISSKDKSVDPQFFFLPGPSNLGTSKWLNRHPEAEKGRARIFHGT